MKINLIRSNRGATNFWAIALSTALVAISSGQSESNMVMQDAVTHNQLSSALRMAEQQDPMKSLKATSIEDPSVANRPKSILADSDIVCFGNGATLVPKRAILQIPKNLADRLVMQPGATLQSWKDFYAINRGWITTVEVTRIQAEGNEPISEDTRKQISKSGNLIVATYQGGPISVLPLKVPETVEIK